MQTRSSNSSGKTVKADRRAWFAALAFAVVTGSVSAVEPPNNIRYPAMLGDPIAQAQLGRIYETGDRGVKKDLDEAVIWYRKAALQRDASAQLALGRIYLEVPKYKDVDEAKKWLEMAASNSSATSAIQVRAQGQLAAISAAGSKATSASQTSAPSAPAANAAASASPTYQYVGFCWSSEKQGLVTGSLKTADLKMSYLTRYSLVFIIDEAALEQAEQRVVTDAKAFDGYAGSYTTASNAADGSKLAGLFCSAINCNPQIELGEGVGTGTCEVQRFGPDMEHAPTAGKGMERLMRHASMRGQFLDLRKGYNSSFLIRDIGWLVGAKAYAPQPSNW